MTTGAAGVTDSDGRPGAGTDRRSNHPHTVTLEENISGATDPVTVSTGTVGDAIAALTDLPTTWPAPDGYTLSGDLTIAASAGSPHVRGSPTRFCPVWGPEPCRRSANISSVERATGS